MAINNTKWYNLHEDIKFCKNWKKSEIENEMHMFIWFLVAMSMITFEGMTIWQHEISNGK